MREDLRLLASALASALCSSDKMVILKARVIAIRASTFVALTAVISTVMVAKKKVSLDRVRQGKRITWHTFQYFMCPLFTGSWHEVRDDF